MYFPDYNCSRVDDADSLNDGTAAVNVTSLHDEALMRGIHSVVNRGTCCRCPA